VAARCLENADNIYQGEHSLPYFFYDRERMSYLPVSPQTCHYPDWDREFSYSINETEAQNG
jgi:hypothetical protein